MYTNNDQQNGKRLLGLSALGVVLTVAGLWIIYLGYQANSTSRQNTPAAYQYTIKQDASTRVHYFDSSFYLNQTPAPTNSAFVSDLTNTLDAQFHYDFTANTATTLTTSYSITAQIQSTYALQGNAESSSNVWQKDYTLLPRTTRTTDGQSVAFDQSAVIPYADYKAVAQQFRAALTLPTVSQVVVTFNVQTTGTVDGAPISDARSSTVTVPLEQQIYQPIVKFDKQDTKQVVSIAAQAGNDRLTRAQLIGGGVLTAAGIALIMYGLRKRIFKSAYRRELDKIYRVNDGILVRTSRPVDLTDHRVVPMRSFEDMLNLEEELKTPIIADEISSTLTHFIIAHNNVTYLYKLGQNDIEKRTPQPVTHVAREVLPPVSTHDELQHVHTYGLAPTLKAPKTMDAITPTQAPATVPKKQVAVQKGHSEVDDIINDIGKKTTRHSKR